MPELLQIDSTGRPIPEFRELNLGNALAAATKPVAAILSKPLDGREMSADEALLLTSADGADLLALVKVADELRRRVSGDSITYVVNRNLNFTNVCIVGCAFCGFSRGPNSHDAYFHSHETLIAKASEAAALGATELCIQGGLPRDLEPFYYRDLLLALKAQLPGIHIHAFSPMEIAYGVEKTRMPLRDYLLMLKQAGLASIPGTAAEILDDSVRRSLSPNKLHASQWIEIVRTAHSVGIPSTSTMMYGHSEQPQHWVRHMAILRDIQKETGGFTEFVPLSFIHSNTLLFRSGRARAGSTRREDLVVHALARLFFHGFIHNIQVSWVKLGFDASLACLNAGANDFGGTLMEESISKAAGAAYGEYVTPEQFRSLTRSIGRIPAERTTLYSIRRTFSPHSDDAAADLAPAAPSALAAPHAPAAPGANC
jgi:7,8-didemethyl-8-hydroxy-5-deazariboflavin synthase CofH subunit